MTALNTPAMTALNTPAMTALNTPALVTDRTKALAARLTAKEKWQAGRPKTQEARL